MNDIINSYIDSLINFSNAKIDALEKILLITNNQSEVVNEVDTTKLFVLIDEKQKQINFIDDIDNQFANILEQLKKELGVNSLDEIDGKKITNMQFLKECITQIFSLVKRIQEIETKNNETLNNAKKEITQKIDKINSGKKILANYRAMPVRDPMFIDRKK